MRLKHLSVALSMLVSLSAVVWGAQEFKIEPGWSQIEFGVRNLGIHTVEGRFKSFSGTINYDETDITRSTVTVVIQIASIDTGIKKRDKHLQTADFFEATKYPDMSFRSERIEKKGDGYVMTGPLTIKGTAKEVELPFTYSLDKSPDGKPILHAQASGVIDRHDFGINYGSNFSVGRVVHILIQIQALP
jgi:polyisoprenoid-binding protein YceI